jgi:hypothetical protein
MRAGRWHCMLSRRAYVSLGVVANTLGFGLSYFIALLRVAADPAVHAVVKVVA